MLIKRKTDEILLKHKKMCQKINYQHRKWHKIDAIIYEKKHQNYAKKAIGRKNIATQIVQMRFYLPQIAKCLENMHSQKPYLRYD